MEQHISMTAVLQLLTRRDCCCEVLRKSYIFSSSKCRWRPLTLAPPKGPQKLSQICKHLPGYSSPGPGVQLVRPELRQVWVLHEMSLNKVLKHFFAVYEQQQSALIKKLPRNSECKFIHEVLMGLEKKTIKEKCTQRSEAKISLFCSLGSFLVAGNLPCAAHRAVSHHPCLVSLAVVTGAS